MKYFSVLAFAACSLSAYGNDQLAHTCEDEHIQNERIQGDQVQALSYLEESDSLPNIALDSVPLSLSMESIKNHIEGSNTLSTDGLVAQQSIIEANLTALENDQDAIKQAFDLVALYDATHGALFTTGTTTHGGISPRTKSGYELENVILVVMQGILDHSYSAGNLSQYPSLFDDTKFETSSNFPGAVTPPSNKSVSYTIKVNGKHVKDSGIPANYVTEDARRPTGTYLAPGSVAKVTVPESLVGIGASVLVGAHTWDHTVKPNAKRMDRVTTKYEITNETISIANPLGGGIYINIPFEQDLGVIDITLENVVRSPYYANTAANKTSLTQWQNVERQHDAPWADFESDKFMIQVPTSWIYALDDPSQMLEDWDLSMDAISELFARPLVRSKTVVYAQVDIQSRGFANFPGYPQANVAYTPGLDYGGDHDNYLLRGPRGLTGYLPTVFFHELGHAENFHKFRGEVEASVNFLWVAVHNKKFGVDLNTAFSESRYSLEHTIEKAAQTWMIAENFRNGNPMSNTTGQFRQEFAYQPRGYAKYADIVRMFGWEALEQFFHNLNVDHDNGVEFGYHVSNVPWDEQSLRLSIASGYDLTPLFHFWGIHPENPDALQASIQANNLKTSAAIYDQLLAYREIVPKDNAAFKALGLEDFSQSKIVNYNNTLDHKPLSYFEGFLNAWWDEYDTNEAQAAVEQVQKIIDLYYPNGRPETQETPTTTPVPTNGEAVVHMRKRNAMNYAIDGNNGGENGQDVYLWQSNENNINQQWVEIDRGEGFYSYQKNNTEFCLDGRTGGANGQNVHLWTCNGANQNQHWKKVNLNNGHYRLEKRNAPGFSIDGNNGGNNQQSLYLWSSSDTNQNQQWYFSH